MAHFSELLRFYQNFFSMIIIQLSWKLFANQIDIYSDQSLDSVINNEEELIVIDKKKKIKADVIYFCSVIE